MRNSTAVILISYLSFLVFVLVCTFLEVTQRAESREQSIRAELVESNDKIEHLERQIALDEVVPIIPGSEIFLQWPIHPDDYRRKTSPIGRRAPVAGGQCVLHKGLDAAGVWRARIRAALDGKVSDFGFDAIRGNFLELSHDGGFKTRYYHLSEIYPEYRRIGTRVETNTEIGRQGNTGFSDRAHLHFEVLQHGIHKNPLRYLQEDPQ